MKSGKPVAAIRIIRDGNYNGGYLLQFRKTQIETEETAVKVVKVFLR